ncbi:glycosyltransferase family A protein [Halobacterium sp. BOL4-2]|uniref:glycosyltransferase family A protein n=1 Tax=Halobacterium sp. BOL4-2 TaxID=2810537 RepID=UPI001E47D4E0|nr:glycosyltransferase family A protein [Halobacterium sp. BOL4-2]QRY24866.2 glycosyltransferase family 2 protein [Halobacterium sp. BOL4-2]
MKSSISVIIPSYNRPRYAIRAAKSAIEQTIQPNELILVNDGSTVDYGEVQQELSSLPVKTEYIETKNQGASQARNTGVEKANGDIYMFLDDDDKWSQKKIENQLEVFNSNSGVGLVSSAGSLVDENNNLIHYISPHKEGDLSREILIKNHVGSTSGVAVKREIFESTTGFDSQLPGLQDYDLWIRICQKTLVGIDNQKSVFWTRHKNTTEQMTGNPDRYVQAVKMLRKKHREKYDSLSYFEQRRAKARQMAGIADRYSNVGSARKFKYAVRSLLYYPTLRGVTELFPDKIVAKVRRCAHYWGK